MFFHTTQGCLAAAGTCPFKHTPLRDIHSSDSGMYATQSEPVKNYTLGEQRELADKAIRKVCAFLHGAHRWEARYADYPNDSVTIDSSGVVLSAAQLEVGVRYNVFWDYEGKKGEDLGWKFRGDGGLAGTICGMEESMAVDPNIGMPGNLLQMASTSWARSFYDVSRVDLRRC
jgi:hypothetical protein